MSDVPTPINVGQNTGKVKPVVIFNDEGISSKDAIPVFYRGKSEVDITHVPMDIFNSTMTTGMFEELVKHLSFQRIVLPVNFIERNLLSFSHLMDRK